MKIRKCLISVLTMIAVCLASFSGCAKTGRKTALKTIIIPKFEINEMAGDFPGEAQLFYEKYCKTYYII